MPCLFPCILWFSLVEGKHGDKHNFQLLLQASDNEYPLEGAFGSISEILLVPCLAPCLMVEFCVYHRSVTIWEADDCPLTIEELLGSTLGLLWNQAMDFQLFCFHEKLCILKCMHYCANRMTLDISAQISQREIAEERERERERGWLLDSLSLCYYPTLQQSVLWLSSAEVSCNLERNGGCSCCWLNNFLVLELHLRK
jgi:hypothetical protein